MSKIPGVGYNPGPGTVYWVWPGGEAAGTTKFNPDTPDPFTAASGQFDLAAFNKRYGGRPVRGDGTIGLFVVDAETVLGALVRAMEKAAADGAEPEFKGTAATHTMIPTIREAHDYAAVHQDGGRFLMSRYGIGGGAAGQGGTSGPGQPRIEKIESPAPGRIALSWVTGQADSFEVVTTPSVGSSTTRRVEDQKKGNLRSFNIDLPADHGGVVQVAVRAFRGETGGKWSMGKRVTVQPRQGGTAEPPAEAKDITKDSLAVTALQLLKSRGYTREQIAAAWESV
jgi:hypothetical protein